MSRTNLIGVSLIQFLLGYEFFDSGWNKLFATHNPSFAAGLADNLKSGIQGMSGGYINWIKTVAIPHAVVLGYMTEWGEFLAGIALIAAAAVFLFRKPDDDMIYKIFAGLSILALLGTLYMSLNFWGFAGAASPLPGGQDGFGEGVTIDFFGPLLATVLIWWNATGLRAALSIKKAMPGVDMHRHHEMRAS